MKKFLIICVLILSAIFCVLFTNPGRNFLLKSIVTYYDQDIKISIDGSDPALHQISKITIDSPQKFIINIDHVKILREKFFTIPFVEIAQINVQSFDNSNKSADISNIKKIAKFMPLFVSGMRIDSINLPHKLHLKDINYDANKNRIKLQSEEYGYFDIQLISRLVLLDDLHIKFKKCLGVDGKLFVSNIFGKQKKYSLFLSRDDTRLNIAGHLKNFESPLILDDFSLQLKKNLITGSGIVDLKQKKVSLNVPIDLKNLDYHTPEWLRNLLQNRTFQISYDWPSNGRITLQDNSADIIAADIQYQDGKLIVNGVCHDVAVYGYKITKFNIVYNKAAHINLFTDNLHVSADITESTIQNATLKTDGGYAQILSPIKISDPNNVQVVLDFRKLDFLSNVAKISGEAKGYVHYNNGIISGDINCANLAYNEIKGKQIHVSGNLNIFKVTVEQLKYDRLTLQNILFSKNNKIMNCSGNIMQKMDFSLSGFLANNRFVVSQGKLYNAKNIITLSDGSFDYHLKNLKMNLDVNDQKNAAELNISPAEIDCSLNNFPCAKIVEEFCDTKFSKMISGGIKLRSVNNVFIGDGNFSINSLFMKHNNLQCNLKLRHSNVLCDAKIENKGHCISANVALPYIFKDNFSIQPTNVPIKAKIFGADKVENFFVFADGTDLRGDFDCDLVISGDIKKPDISGHINCKKMLIAVGSVILQNGDIELYGDHNYVRVKNATFTDYHGKKAVATGYTQCGFSKIPIFDVNLDLGFDNFCLLNSDVLRVVVAGRGKMFGPIHDLSLSGKINVPVCRIFNWTTYDENITNGINFENDKYLSPKKNNQHVSKSFFNYDIDMKCPKVLFDGKMFNVVFAGHLKLRNWKERETLIGDLKLKHGKIDLFGKRMTFTSGSVHFLEEYPFDPKIKLSAQKNLGDMLVMLDIVNSPKKGASFALHSSPNYSKDIILSNILFGKDINSLSVGETAQLAHVMTQLNRTGFIFAILDVVNSIGPWDNISFGSENSGYISSVNSDSHSENKTQKVNISAGKYLHDNVYVSLNKKEKETTFDVDISVTPSMSVKANTAGEVGVSWKYRY